jgi:hypothetical protein
VRLLACDVDGTLITTGERLSEETRKALLDLRALGIEVVLATGRSPWGIHDLCEDLGLLGPQITMQGALVVSPLSGAIMAAHTMSPASVSEQVEFARSLGLDCVVCYPFEHRLQKLTPGLASSVPRRFLERGHIREVASIAELAGDSAVRTLVFPPEGLHQTIRGALEREFGSRFSITWGDEDAVEILAGGVSKGSALIELASHLGIDMAEVAAIGDGRNDLEMLSTAGRSAAMAWAPQDVRAAATLVVGEGREDGAREALEHFFPRMAHLARGTI